MYVFESYYEGRENFCFQPQANYYAHTVLIYNHGRENSQIHCIVAVWFMPQNKQHPVVCWVFADVSVLPAYRSLRNFSNTQQTTGRCLFCSYLFMYLRAEMWTRDLPNTMH